MSSRRSHYRARQGRRPIVVILTADGAQVPGKVLDLSIHGCGAKFERGSLPPLRNGQRVSLEFRALLLLEPLRVEAFVRRTSQERELALVGFEFCEPDAVRSEVPYVLVSEFNCRKHPRAPIDDVVSVRVQSPDLEEVALLLDVSAGGVQLRISPALALRVHEGDALELRFTLPERPEGFWLAGIVRSLRVGGDYVGCSICFDGETTVDFEQQRDALDEIVQGRRTATLARLGPGTKA